MQRRHPRLPSAVDPCGRHRTTPPHCACGDARPLTRLGTARAWNNPRTEPYAHRVRCARHSRGWFVKKNQGRTWNTPKQKRAINHHNNCPRCPLYLRDSPPQLKLRFAPSVDTFSRGRKVPLSSGDTSFAHGFMSGKGVCQSFCLSVTLRLRRSHG